MHILTFSLGELETNTYLIIKDNQCVLIDPADEASFILEEIQRRNLHLAGMIATHGHFDHILAAGEIQAGINLPLYINSKDSFLVKRTQSTAKHFLGHNQILLPVTKTQHLQNGKMVLGPFVFNVIETPGHTPGGCCFYFSSEQAVFTGDTLFKGAVGRTDLSYSSKKDLQDSIRRLMESLPEETVIYPGHGESTTIIDEKSNLI